MTLMDFLGKKQPAEKPPATAAEIADREPILSKLLYEGPFCTDMDGEGRAVRKKLVLRGSVCADKKGEPKFLVERSFVFEGAEGKDSVQDCVESRTEEEAIGIFYAEKEMHELCCEGKILYGRYFWDYEVRDGKVALTRKLLGKFEGVWI